MFEDLRLTKPEIDIIKPEWPSSFPKTVDALFTCRTGGVSSGPYGGSEGIMGLNLGTHTGDVPSCVAANRSIVSQLLPADPVWMNQVHGIRVIDAEFACGVENADAAVTTEPGVVCTVMVADCLPVLIANEEGTAVAAVHAGWKSLAGGILQETVRKIRNKTGSEDRLIAWMGPRIGAESFEVGEDVLLAMQKHLPDAESAFRPGRPGKYFADLAMLARMALVSCGVADADIADCALSTYADKSRFYSYRRDGAESGRHAAMIWIHP